MSANRSRNAIWNYASGLVFTFVTLGIALFTTPLIETWIGSERFGAYRAMADCFAYLALLELGLGGALSPILARALARGDRHELRDLLAVGLRCYMMVLGLALAAGLVLTQVIPWLVPVEHSGDDLRLASLIALAGLLSLPMLPFRFLIDAEQLGYRVSLATTFQAVVVVFLTMFLTSYFPQWGIAAQALAVSIGTVGISGLFLLDVRKRHPDLLTGLLRVRPSPGAWRSIWRLSWPTLVVAVCTRLGLYSDNIVLGKILGPVQVTVLFFTIRLAQAAQGPLFTIAGASWAGLAELYNRGELETFRQRMLELMRLIMIVGLVGLGPVVVYGRHFVAIWKGPDFYGGDLVVLLACVNSVLATVSLMASWSLSGTGKIRMLVGRAIFAAVLKLAAGIALTYKYGLVGPLLGASIVLVAVDLTFYPRILRREFGLSPSALYRTLLTPAALGTIYFGALWWLVRGHAPGGWTGLILEMSLAALGFLAISFVFLLGPEERARWRDRLLRAVNRAPRTAPRPD